MTGFTCIAAPILGAGREPVAVLNASCWRLSRAVAPDLVLDLVAQSARRIANGFFARRHTARRVLRVSRFGDFTDAGAEGRLALDAEDRIVDATVEALSLVGGVGVSPIGMRFAELPLLDPDDPGVDTAARRPAGGRLFARLLETPRRWRPRRPPAVAMRRSTHPDLAEIQGLDPTLETAIARAGRIVAQGVPLLIAGETGVGKTALAQALHAAGPWRAGGFARLDCAAAGTTELEAAFARRRDDPGPGTLFLDAAGDLAPASQARLVGLLAREEETPVAGALIAACTRGPAEEPGSTLRPDLRFRLAGFVLDMPPLRARADRDDVIERVLRDEARRAGLVAAAPDPAVLRALRAHPWPGNFLELRHAARAAIACAHGGKVTLATLPDALRAAEAPPPAARPARRRDAIEAALQRAGWNVRRAALALGMSRATLHRRIRALGLARPARSRATGGAAGLRS